MKLSEIKKHLETAEAVNFILPTGAHVPEHFHVTEVGLVTKHFIDCGGVERLEKVVNLQLWNANDFEHRLKPQKLSNIISLSETKLGIGDLEIEVEYQSDTIGKYGLHFNGKDFVLVPKQTACLATDACGSPVVKQKFKMQELQTAGQNHCMPGGGCC
jgi:Family of unknown function (DUF6428)